MQTFGSLFQEMGAHFPSSLLLTSVAHIRKRGADFKTIYISSLSVKIANYKMQIRDLTVFIHAHLQALLEAAGLALVPVRLVHNTAPRAGLASKDNQKPRYSATCTSGSVSTVPSCLYGSVLVNESASHWAREISIG
jgi:hypothetical protein